MGMQIDDAHFRNLLLETQVLSTKDHGRWSLEILTELLEGPLLNSRRLDEATRASKFMRRLLSFFHPFSYRYSDVVKTSVRSQVGVGNTPRLADFNPSQQTAKFTQLACTTLSTLVANPDGVRYLLEDKLLPQIADCLAQLDPVSFLEPLDVPLPTLTFWLAPSWVPRSRRKFFSPRTGWIAVSHQGTSRCWGP